MSVKNQYGILNTPYGGKLFNLVVSSEEREELVARSTKLPSVQISARSLCDLELLATGAWSGAGVLGPGLRLRGSPAAAGVSRRR